MVDYFVAIKRGSVSIRECGSGMVNYTNNLYIHVSVALVTSNNSCIYIYTWVHRYIAIFTGQALSQRLSNPLMAHTTPVCRCMCHNDMSPKFRLDAKVEV